MIQFLAGAHQYSDLSQSIRLLLANGVVNGTLYRGFKPLSDGRGDKIGFNSYERFGCGAGFAGM